MVRPVTAAGGMRNRHLGFDMAIAIHIESVVKRYGDKVAVDRLSLSVAEGELFAFLGPNVVSSQVAPPDVPLNESTHCTN